MCDLHNNIYINTLQSSKTINIVIYYFVIYCYFVILGSGGSTLMVLSKLKKLYGNVLKDKRILLMNAGGLSQRVPSTSILGKIFCPLPLNLARETIPNFNAFTDRNSNIETKCNGTNMLNGTHTETMDKYDKHPIMQQLDFKLANSLPFLSRMQPGFFHACSDTVEVYDLGDETEAWTFNKPGFTAVAHPSSLRVGTGHGVYLLHKDKGDSQTLTDMRECREVIQKPTVETMREKGFIEKRLTSSGDLEDIVYTDSCFFFDHNVADKLCDFYDREKPLNCEIDSYGDFIQGLGSDSTIDYTNDLRNVSKVEPKLLETRRKIFHLLRDVPLNMVLLKASNFYHLGSITEMMYHFTKDITISRDLGFQKNVSTSIIPECSDGTVKRSRVDNSLFSGCSMHNSVTEGARLHSTSVMEYCNFSVPCNIAKSCVLSNCEYTDDGVNVINVKSETFLHTIPIKENKNGIITYVTVLFSTCDDIKRVSDEVLSLPYYGNKLLSVTSAWSTPTISFTHNHKMSLWNARLFPACDTMSASFKRTQGMMDALQGGAKVDLSEERLYSMADLTVLKSVQEMLRYRNKLYTKISAS